MSTSQPTKNVQVEAHSSDWANILTAIFQGIEILGPIVIQLIETAEGVPTKITIQ